MADGGNQFDLVVAGGGMVGMSTALWAQMMGLRVVLCDPAPPGSGTTSGSACTIATYACIPVNSPAILAALPRLLLHRDSPLGFNFGHGLRNPRWSLSFLANCRGAAVRRIVRELGQFLAQADAGLDPLIAAAGAEDLVVSKDCLYVWSTPEAYRAAATSNAMRRAQGVVFEELSAKGVRALEPNLRIPVHAGLHFRGARHVLSPRALVRRMQDRFAALGGIYLAQDVASCRADDGGVAVTLGDGQQVRGGHLALTAGAFSRRIRGTGAERLPLGTERGYHVLFRQHGGLISRPVGWAEAGFYATPMAEGLRIAGTVEINDIDAPPNRGRIAYLTRKSHEMFGDLGPPDSDWMGFRPTMPDALPVIGRSPVSDRILFGFGHQHIGLTLGGITGRVLAELASGQTPSCRIEGFDAARF